MLFLTNSKTDTFNVDHLMLKLSKAPEDNICNKTKGVYYMMNYGTMYISIEVENSVKLSTYNKILL